MFRAFKGRENKAYGVRKANIQLQDDVSVIAVLTAVVVRRPPLPQESFHLEDSQPSFSILHYISFYIYIVYYFQFSVQVLPEQHYPQGRETHCAHDSQPTNPWDTF